MRLDWQIFAVGKPKLEFAARGVEEYLGRLKKTTSVELEFIRVGSRIEESAALLRRSEGMYRVALDERGHEFTSIAFAAKIQEWRGLVHSRIALLIGGADGHDAIVRESSQLVWSLSQLTLQHELALVVLLEQLYRAHAILNHTPYHRA